jgi:hypothetical protein
MSSDSSVGRPTPNPDTFAQRTRLMADCFRNLAGTVRESFQFDDPAQRVRMLQHLDTEILANMLPVVGWLERRYARLA